MSKLRHRAHNYVSMANYINIKANLRITGFYRRLVAAIFELYSKLIVKSHQRLFQRALYI